MAKRAYNRDVVAASNQNRDNALKLRLLMHQTAVFKQAIAVLAEEALLSDIQTKTEVLRKILEVCK